MTLLRHLDGYDVRAQLYLERQLHRGAFMIVEGETDFKALSKFVQADHCSLIIANGKKNALEAMDLLDDDGFDRVVCLVDADFDRLNGTDRSSAVVWVTDAHDLDATIFASSALDAYLTEFGDATKIQILERRRGKTIREIILEASAPIGRLRWINEQRHCRLNFQKLTYSFISETTLACDEVALIAEVLANSSAVCCDAASLKVALQQCSANEFDLLQLSCGHDIAAVTGVALRELIGNRFRDAHTWGREIESGLRLAFDFRAFSSTDVFRGMKEWRDNNARFQILVLA
jgi:hypothetical protein